MTLNEITVLIASDFDRQFDEPFKLMLGERVKYWRSRLIRNSLEKDARERKFFTQPIYVPMTKSSPVPCASPVDLCPVAMSVDIPKPIRANGILFDYVGAIDGSNAFSLATSGTLSYLLKGRYSHNSIRFNYMAPRVLVYKDDIPTILINAVWDDPEAAAKLNCSTRNIACNFWDEEYPITNDLLQLVVQSINQIDFNRGVKPQEIEIKATDNDKGA